jgi:hypothetical protein
MREISIRKALQRLELPHLNFIHSLPTVYHLYKNDESVGIWKQKAVAHFNIQVAGLFVERMRKSRDSNKMCPWNYKERRTWPSYTWRHAARRPATMKCTFMHFESVLLKCVLLTLLMHSFPAC